MRLPLEGLRVVDLTVVWAGPSASRILADWGAEVVRPEPLNVFLPNTRGAVAHPPPGSARPGLGYMHAPPDYELGLRPWNRMPIFTSTARNKFSMTVNMSEPEGREKLLELVAVSDIVIENYAPDTIDRLQLGFDECSAVNPGLVMVRMPTFGLSGQYSKYRSYGQQVECAIGHMLLRGDDEIDPTLRGDVWSADAAAGVGAAFAALMALREKSRTGKGQLVEFSQAEFFIPFLGQAVLDYTLNGRVQGTLGNRHPDMAPHGVYPCRGEDRWIAIAVRTDEEFAAFCAEIGDPDLADDERFATLEARLVHQDELDSLVGKWTAPHDVFELFHRLQGVGVAAGPAMNEADLYADQHLEDREFFQPLTHAEYGTHLYPGLTWKQSRTHNYLRMPPCRLGEHNEYVYRKILGVSEAEYRNLEALGHIAMDFPADVP